jgi:hypothetical protein
MGLQHWIRFTAGAVGVTLVSRLLGFAREGVIVGIIGVHDFTDAYFALSSIVLWLQNWSFGAFALYFIPRYLSIAPEERRSWFGVQIRRNLKWGIFAGGAFVVGFRWIEPLMLGGRQVFGTAPTLLLACCLPLTVIGGLLSARLLSTAEGILPAALVHLYANALGFASLIVFAFSPGGKPLALPVTLLVTQGAVVILLSRASSRYGDTPDRGRVRPPGLRARGQLSASTAENVGFNLSAVIQQAIAGALATGAVTLNAYAVRLVLLPLTGMLQPVQQYLLVRFASGDAVTARKMINITASIALALGLILGGALYFAFGATRWFWGDEWNLLFTTFRFGLVVFCFGVYAGVVFTNQAIARYSFSNHHGWTYAGVMLVAYATGTVIRFIFAPSFGILALVGASIVTELAAAGILLVFINGRHLQSHPVVTVAGKNPIVG